MLNSERHPNEVWRITPEITKTKGTVTAECGSGDGEIVGSASWLSQGRGENQWTPVRHERSTTGDDQSDICEPVLVQPPDGLAMMYGVDVRSIDPENVTSDDLRAIGLSEDQMESAYGQGWTFASARSLALPDSAGETRLLPMTEFKHHLSSLKWSGRNQDELQATCFQSDDGGPLVFALSKTEIQPQTSHIQKHHQAYLEPVMTQGLVSDWRVGWTETGTGRDDSITIERHYDSSPGDCIFTVDIRLADTPLNRLRCGIPVHRATCEEHGDTNESVSLPEVTVAFYGVDFKRVSADDEAQLRRVDLTADEVKSEETSERKLYEVSSLVASRELGTTAHEFNEEKGDEDE